MTKYSGLRELIAIEDIDWGEVEADGDADITIHTYKLVRREINNSPFVNVSYKDTAKYCYQ